MSDLEQTPPRGSPGPFDGWDDVPARALIEAAPDALLLVGVSGDIVLVNEPAERLFGYGRDELVGRPVDMLAPAALRVAHARRRRDYWAAPARRLMGEASLPAGLRKDGSSFPAEIGLSPLRGRHGLLVMAAVRDISRRPGGGAGRGTPSRERALFDELARLARQDALTGLPNRMVLQDRLATAMASARRNGHRLGVACLGLDHFKHVNDSLGHGVGDGLLRSVAARLTSCVRRSDTVSRQGGDEFVVLLPAIGRREDLAASAAKVGAAMAAPHSVAGHDLHITASIGLAMFPEDGIDAETLVRRAEIAMYRAKDRGRGHFAFFTPEMDAAIAERRAVEVSLRRALARQEFVLYYQPKVDLATGALSGAEALIRWRHPDRGLVTPEAFVPVAEQTGLIVPIGQWVLREACRQAREWQDRGLRPLPVAVNISAVEFRSPGFVEGVRRILDQTGFDPRLLEMELTESVLMENVAAAADMLRELKALGLRLALDDFGTGFSSLSYLTALPFDALKVDRAFVSEIAGGDDLSPIVTAVIAMGRSLGRRVTAEGVETEQQLAFLRAQRCEEGQGFHLGRPLPAEGFAALLAS